MRQLTALIATLSLLFSGTAQASISPSYPYTLQNGTTADASQVQSNFNQIQSDVNTNAAHNGANSDITSLTGLTTALGLTYGGTPIYVGGTSGGSGNAQTFTTTTPNSFALTQGFMVSGIAGFTNSGAATLAVHSLTAKAIEKHSTSGLVALTGNEIIAGNPYLFYYDGTEFVVLNPTLPSNIVTGPGSSTSGNLPTFSGTSGNVLQDSGIQATALATKASPAFTGTPTAPTAASGTSTTQLATTAFANPSTSNTANGSVTLPGGTIIQWGSVTHALAGGVSQTITFPSPFPNNLFSFSYTCENGSNGDISYFILTSSSTSNLVLNSSCNRHWIAIGN